MSITQLRMKIMEINQSFSSQIDKEYAKTITSGAGWIVGKVLGCEEELGEEVEKDELLNDSIHKIMSFKLGLAGIPIEYKAMGSFVCDTFKAYKTKRTKLLREAELLKKMEQLKKASEEVN
jgi:5-methylthioribose kinase